MPWQLVCCEATILRDIACPELKRRDIAQVYALILQSEEARTVDWGKINRAIIARWSKSALEWIKAQAWSGRCWPKPEEES